MWEVFISGEGVKTIQFPRYDNQQMFHKMGEKVDLYK